MDINTTIDDDIVRNFLFTYRFPSLKPSCIKCGKFAYKNADMSSYTCSSKLCKHKFGITAGTIFSCSKLSLSKIVCAIYLIGIDPKISSPELARRLGIRQKAGWFLRKDIKSEDDLMQRMLKRMDLGVEEKVRTAIFNLLESYKPSPIARIEDYKKKDISLFYTDFIKYATHCLIKFGLDANAKEIVHDSYLLLTRLDRFSIKEMRKKIFEFCRAYRNQQVQNNLSLGILHIKPKNRLKQLNPDKVCKICQENLPIGEFYAQVNISTGQKIFSPNCKNCTRDLRGTKAKYFDSFK